jgi:hypothetical protein
MLEAKRSAINERVHDTEKDIVNEDTKDDCVRRRAHGSGAAGYGVQQGWLDAHRNCESFL